MAFVLILLLVRLLFKQVVLFIFEMKILVIGILTFLITLSTNHSAFAFGQKAGTDLVFDVQGLKTSPVTNEFKINGEVWDEICPSNFT